MSQPGRGRVSLSCIVIGALALALALPLAYLDRNVFEPKGFADNAAATLKDEAVRAELSQELTRELVAREPQAVSLAPVILSISDSLLRTGQARSLVRAAAVETHNAVFSATKGSVVIDLANLGVIAFQLLESQRPSEARDLSQPRKIALQLSDRSLTVRAIEVADSVRFLAVVLPLVALALFALGLFVVADRRRAALNVGMAVFMVGALNFAAFLIVRAVLLTGQDGDRREVVGGVFDAFMGRFPLWCGLLGFAGAIVAASAASVIGELDPARVPALLWAHITREPDATWKLVIGALALILIGSAVIGDPLGAVRLAVAIFGAWLIFAGAVTLLRLIMGPAPTAEQLPSVRAFTSVAQLRSPTSCRPNRGGTGKPLFLVNHWVESYPPRPRDADVVNQLPFLLERARECERERDAVVNMLAVDFAERGDVLAAADSLNASIRRPQFPEVEGVALCVSACAASWRGRPIPPSLRSAASWGFLDGSRGHGRPDMQPENRRASWQSANARRTLSRISTPAGYASGLPGRSLMPWARVARAGRRRSSPGRRTTSAASRTSWRTAPPVARPSAAPRPARRLARVRETPRSGAAPPSRPRASGRAAARNPVPAEQRTSR